MKQPSSNSDQKTRQQILALTVGGLILIVAGAGCIAVAVDTARPALDFWIGFVEIIGTLLIGVAIGIGTQTRQR